MWKYSCLIIEDEPLAAEVLSDYIKQVPFLRLAGICTDGFYAMEMLQTEKIDLIFLDIHLPKMKGLAFLEALKQPPAVIITSAYKEYALQGYELNVLDYLLKPIRLGRFLKAVAKLEGKPEKSLLATVAAQGGERDYFFFTVGKKKIKVYLDEILYVESIREYIRITTMEKSILTRLQLHKLEATLCQHNFIRIHRSFMVARDKISAFSSTDVEVGGKQLPIGRSYKEQVVGILEKSHWQQDEE